MEPLENNKCRLIEKNLIDKLKIIVQYFKDKYNYNKNKINLIFLSLLIITNLLNSLLFI